MSETTSSIRNRFGEMPRPLRWLAVVVFGTVLFLLWDTAIRPYNDELRSEADRLEQRVRTIRDASGLNAQLRSMKDVVASVGGVELPGTESEATSALQTVVNDVLKQYPRVSNDRFSARPEGKLRRGVLDEVARGRRIETLRGDLSFEAAPDEAMAIVAELESSPAVERITSLQFNRIGSGKLRVRLSLESWVLGSES